MRLFNVHQGQDLDLTSTLLKMMVVTMVLQVIAPHLAALPATLPATDYGIVGEVFPIQEKNLVEVIQAKLLKLQADGKLETYNSQIQAKVKSQIERPTPVSNITHTKTSRTFTFDPSITVTADLKDHQGVVFHHKGEKVNPLDYRSLTKPLLFIDGDSSEQITWAFRALKIHPLAKIILTNGAPLKIMQEIGIPIYFDQHGKLTQKLGIACVPAIVTQDENNKLLKIQEVRSDAIQASGIGSQGSEANEIKREHE